MLTRFCSMAGPVGIASALVAGMLVPAWIARPVDGRANAPSTQDKPALTDLAWMAGTWREERGPDVLQERWDPPLGNAMTGTLSWLKEDKATLYEFMLLEEDSSGVHLYVRHFTPGCVSREEKDAPVALQLAESTFTFESAGTGTNTAVFTSEAEFPHRYEVKKDPDGVLHAVVEGVKDGQPTKLEFAFKPVPR